MRKADNRRKETLNFGKPLPTQVLPLFKGGQLQATLFKHTEKILFTFACLNSEKLKKMLWHSSAHQLRAKECAISRVTDKGKRAIVLYNKQGTLLNFLPMPSTCVGDKSFSKCMPEYSTLLT